MSILRFPTQNPRPSDEAQARRATLRKARATLNRVVATYGEGSPEHYAAEHIVEAARRQITRGGIR